MNGRMEFGDIEVVIPDLAEPVRSYRMFRLSSHESVHDVRTLDSLRGYSWEPGINKAQCIRSGTQSYSFGTYISIPNQDDSCGECPSPTAEHHNMGYGCGIYGYNDLLHLSHEWKDEADFGRRVVIAEILQWGKVYQHTLGHRSEYAEITRLFFGSDTWVLPVEMYRTADYYNVPLLPIVDEILTTPYPAQVMESMGDKMLEKAFAQQLRVRLGKTDKMPESFQERIDSYDFWNAYRFKYPNNNEGESNGSNR